MRNWTVALSAAAMALSVFATGCAEEREPINRVQANALDKQFYIGKDFVSGDDDPEFYTAVTIVDVPYGADQGSVFPGLVGSMHRIKWEITETTINARMTYEMFDGVDGHGARTTNTGEVIAAFEIVSHFDIRQEYNPSTGEQINLVVENTSDRPWYQRRYFRVDWSENLISSSRLWDPLAGDSFDIESLSYYVSDPKHPDAVHFGDNYFDFTNKLHLTPKMIDMGAGPMPACFYRASFVVGATYPFGNCENSEITVRYAFRQVAQEGDDDWTDYEPKNWDGSRMSSYGIFTRDRMGWDDNYGIVDTEWRRFAQRYNIWQRSHSDVECGTEASAQRTIDDAAAQGLVVGELIDPLSCDAERDGDFDCDGSIELEQGEFVDGTHDECAPLWGSKCDGLVKKCTLPLSQREIRTVAWHYTVNTDDAVIYESTEHAVWQWDGAIRVGVQAGRYAECVRTGTGSLVGSPWESSYTGYVDEISARAVCGPLFPINQSYDDAELDAVRDVNICTANAYDFAEGSGDAYLDRYAKCSAAATTAVAGMEPLVVLCHNPVSGGDHPSCGEAGKLIRPGDIRYHQVNVWPTRQNTSPWGYGPSLSDPLTGEIISAGINVYNAVTDASAQSFVDQVRWINGEISTDDITSGKYVHDWVQAGNYGKSHGGQQMRKEDVDQRIAGISGLDIDVVENQRQLVTPEDMANTYDAIKQLEAEVVPPGTIPEDRSIFEERLKKAREEGVEAELMNGMWLQMAGVDPQLPAEQQLEMASPLRGMSSRTAMHLHDAAQDHFASIGQCILGAPEPTGIPSVAIMMREKFPYDETANIKEQNARVARMWDYLRWKMNYTVILHEMGHTVGLRHNFVSSYDKYNYKTQYWQLRDDAGRITKECNGTTNTDGADCIGPRYYDPLTQDEIDNSIWTWQQTTVMDYAGDLTQDMLGLGIYDMAAARIFYGDVVDVRTDMLNSDPVGAAVESMVQYPGYTFGQVISIDGEFVYPYTKYNETYKLVQPERCVGIEPAQPVWWDDEKWGTWNALWDGHIIHNTRCARPPTDFVQWEDLVADNVVVDFDDPDYFTPKRGHDKFDRPRVPHGFLTDNYADGWSPSAYRHDNGADMYEEVLFHSNLYENRHIFDNYRNGKSSFTIYGAYQRAISRYHMKIENLTQGFAYVVDYIFRELADNNTGTIRDYTASYIDAFLEDHAVAAALGFDHFVRVMTRPHTGQHYCASGALGGCTTSGDRVLLPTEDEIGGLPDGKTVVGYIPNGQQVAGDSVYYAGRPINNGFQYNHGFWTFDYLNQAGSYYEKTFAMESMLNATYGAINFFRWDGIDSRFRHVNFSDLWPEGMRRFIGSALTEDSALLGPRMSANATGQPNMGQNGDGIDYPVDPLAWVSFVPPNGPQSCAPVDGVLACTNSSGTPISNGAPAETNAWYLSPQLGYEVQKFIIFWYYVYQPGKETLDWVDQLRIFRTGTDVNPDYLPAEIVEWKDPESGLRYFARSYGDEDLFGKTYDKGIGAKMIQWAQQLSAEVYVLDAVTPFDPDTGNPNVVYNTDGTPQLIGNICDDNPKCEQLRRYRGLLDFARDTAARMGFPEPALQIFTP